MIVLLAQLVVIYIIIIQLVTHQNQWKHWNYFELFHWLCLFFIILLVLLHSCAYQDMKLSGSTV